MVSFNFDQLLRYALSGCLAVFSFFYASPKALATVEAFAGPKDSTLVIAGTIAIGILIYTLHRAVLYPLLYRAMIFIVHKGRYQLSMATMFSPRPLDAELHLDIDRWRSRKSMKSVRDNLTEWGSQVHLLYCCTWSSLIGKTSAHFFATASHSYWDIQMIFITPSFFVISVLHHVRYLMFERSVIDIESHQ